MSMAVRGAYSPHRATVTIHSVPDMRGSLDLHFEIEIEAYLQFAESHITGIAQEEFRRHIHQYCRDRIILLARTFFEASYSICLSDHFSK